MVNKKFGDEKRIKKKPASLVNLPVTAGNPNAAEGASIVEGGRIGKEPPSTINRRNDATFVG